MSEQDRKEHDESLQEFSFRRAGEQRRTRQHSRQRDPGNATQNSAIRRKEKELRKEAMRQSKTSILNYTPKRQPKKKR